MRECGACAREFVMQIDSDLQKRLLVHCLQLQAALRA
jgi:hypothetical protein